MSSKTITAAQKQHDLAKDRLMLLAATNHYTLTIASGQVLAMNLNVDPSNREPEFFSAEVANDLMLDGSLLFVLDEDGGYYIAAGLGDEER